jgi:hypothetical protein
MHKNLVVSRGRGPHVALLCMYTFTKKEKKNRQGLNAGGLLQLRSSPDVYLEAFRIARLSPISGHPVFRDSQHSKLATTVC